MSDKGTSITTAVRQMGKLYESISLLLKSAEEELNTMGWKADRSLAMGGSSNAIYGFRQWAPHYVFRFLPADTKPKQLLFISVILDDVDDPNAVTEPILGMGWFRYAQGAEKTDRRWRHAKQLPLLVKPLGELPATEWQVLKLEDVADAEACGIAEAKVFAVPLVSVTNSDQLLDQFIRPLAIKLGDVRVDEEDRKSDGDPADS